jgi:hypothetical protein
MPVMKMVMPSVRPWQPLPFLRIVNRTGSMSQLSNSSSTYKKGTLSTTERANRIFRLSAEMDAHDRDKLTMATTKCSWKILLIWFEVVISYPNPETTPNGADIGVFGCKR